MPSAPHATEQEAEEVRVAADFAFVLPRPEFSDFIGPILALLRGAGYQCMLLGPYEAQSLIQDCQAGRIRPPTVVVSPNEGEYISGFAGSKKVLLGHSFFIRDTIPSPIEMGADHYFEFDYFFAPSTFYAEWTIRALYDANYVGLGYANAMDQGITKYVIPGGYAKALPPPRAPGGPRPAQPLILYAPSVYSPEHTGHRFHLDGSEILFSLARTFPHARIVCRPHPTDRDHDYVRQMMALFAAQRMDNITFDLSNTPSPTLYADPDVLLTDMSGFGFVYEMLTRQRPIFFIPEDECTKHPRFSALTCQFGRLVHNVQQLLGVVQAQLAQPDLLEGGAASLFDSVFALPYNTVDALMADLIRILKGERGEHWINLPVRYSAGR
ncbi:MAG: hypothetical protein JO171_18320 [Paludibacterium sp.]|uniref:hypothetical protein n=1 Tax=Paludibacterium sp. TaxID=1917523 RepID=UPI0025FDC9B7|nr:hypothetical protein [Paludibacterium sp.]MBV8049109.1 hypothetical protein [Paludibacterium sp.]MBV8648339.1 hypothetical protein [Paludibacterium sp.]